MAEKFIKNLNCTGFAWPGEPLIEKTCACQFVVLLAQWFALSSYLTFYTILVGAPDSSPNKRTIK